MGRAVKPSKPAEDGPITKALMEAVAMRRQMLDAGHPPAYVDQEIGKGLKALLGNTRSEPWKFYCTRCRDTGWINVEPSDAEYARLTAMYGEAPEHAGYVVKCDADCQWLRLEREKRRKQLGQDFTGGDDDLVAAGQVKPKRGFKKFGA